MMKMLEKESSKLSYDLEECKSNENTDKMKSQSMLD